MRIDTICDLRIQHVVSLQYYFSPFYLMYLREAGIPIDLVMENVGEAVPADLNDYVTEKRSRMDQVFQTVRDQLSQAFQRAKQVYKSRVKKLQFKVDDLMSFFCPENGLV